MLINMDVSKIIFTRFCRYKKTMLRFKLLFDISDRSRDIPWKRILCTFSRGDFTPQNCIMAPIKIGLRYG